ncbi:hypothetical protein EYZ11_006505 [Aspergillus tanneri]|uniref:Uncharacterized protein n=1 Tax=Aspergillus tanneri TaxID=1220188 RepID=A0A4S3JF84_9EURO|nr:hypothetical protein EYZ11_006505 [Aspergillus tanneri]
MVRTCTSSSTASDKPADAVLLHIGDISFAVAGILERLGTGSVVRQLLDCDAFAWMGGHGCDGCCVPVERKCRNKGKNVLWEKEIMITASKHFSTKPNVDNRQRASENNLWPRYQNQERSVMRI